MPQVFDSLEGRGIYHHLKVFLINVDMQRKLHKGNLTVLLTPLYSDFCLGAPHEPAAVLKLELCPFCSFRCWCHHVDVLWFICVVFILVVVFLYLGRMSAVLRVKRLQIQSGSVQINEIIYDLDLFWNSIWIFFFENHMCLPLPTAFILQKSYIKQRAIKYFSC